MGATSSVEINLLTRLLFGAQIIRQPQFRTAKASRHPARLLSFRCGILRESSFFGEWERSALITFSRFFKECNQNHSCWYESFQIEWIFSVRVFLIRIPTEHDPFRLTLSSEHDQPLSSSRRWFLTQFMTSIIASNLGAVLLTPWRLIEFSEKGSPIFSPGQWVCGFRLVINLSEQKSIPLLDAITEKAECDCLRCHWARFILQRGDIDAKTKKRICSNSNSSHTRSHWNFASFYTHTSIRSHRERLKGYTNFLTG